MSAAPVSDTDRLRSMYLAGTGGGYNTDLVALVGRSHDMCSFFAEEKN